MTETTLTKKKDRQIINIVAATNAFTRYGREHAHNTHNHCRFFQVYIYNMQMQYPVHNKEIPRSLFSSRCQQIFLTCWLIGRHFIMLRHHPTSYQLLSCLEFSVDRIAGDQSAALPRPTEASVLIVAGHNSSSTTQRHTHRNGGHNCLIFSAPALILYYYLDDLVLPAC